MWEVGRKCYIRYQVQIISIKYIFIQRVLPKEESMSKNITNAQITEGLTAILTGKKARKFTESVELQVGLKDYDPQKDKRFAGSVRLPNIPRPGLKICLIGDAKHLDIVKA